MTNYEETKRNSVENPVQLGKTRYNKGGRNSVEKKTNSVKMAETYVAHFQLEDFAFGVELFGHFGRLHVRSMVAGLLEEVRLNTEIRNKNPKCKKKTKKKQKKQQQQRGIDTGNEVTSGGNFSTERQWRKKANNNSIKKEKVEFQT